MLGNSSPNKLSPRKFVSSWRRNEEKERKTSWLLVQEYSDVEMIELPWLRPADADARAAAMRPLVTGIDREGLSSA